MKQQLLLFFCFLFTKTALFATGGVTGTVTDMNGNPLASAKVIVLRGSTTVIATTTTNQDGSYLLGGIAAGDDYVVRAGLLGFQTAFLGTLIYENQIIRVDFSLANNPGAVAGRVLDYTSHLPIANATVNAIQNDILIGTATTDQ